MNASLKIVWAVLSPQHVQLGLLVALAIANGVSLQVRAEPPATNDQPAAVLQWGKPGEKAGEFHSPICIAISSADEIFVADLNNARVQQFTTQSEFVNLFDLPKDQPSRNSCIVGGLAISADSELFVAFMVQHKIGVYSKKGEWLREWGKQGTGDGEFNQPGGLVIRADGTVVVADQCNHRIQVFQQDGTFVCKWGEHGVNPGQFGGLEPAGSRFAGPHFLTQDRQDRLYTSEAVLGRIQQFSADGKPLAAWGDKMKEPGAFGEYTFGQLKNTFGPIGVFADNLDRIWVSSLNDRVQCFTPEGQFLWRIDGSSPEEPFLHPHGMAMDSHGYFYVADSGNQRIVKFQIPGK